MTNLARENVRNRLRLYGRLAAVLFLGSAVVLLATIPLMAPPARGRIGLVIVAGMALVVGTAAWFAPWQRWPGRASLVLVPVGLAMMAAANYLVDGSDPRRYAVYFVVGFVWIGVAHPPKTSLAVAPLAMLAYVVPILMEGESFKVALSSAAFTILMCVFVGESLALGSRRLQRTEADLDRERQDAEHLREMAELRTTFMTMVSHELRTPITICRGHLDVLSPHPTPGEVRETVAVVKGELVRTSRLIDDMTVVVRGDDPAFIRPAPISVGPFVRDVAAKAQPLLGRRLHVAASGNVQSGRVLADSQRLTQALLNLLQNAAVHAAGNDPVDFRAARVNGDWRFEVEDRGGGLPPELADAAFQPFVQGDRSAGGMGLGLAIVQAIAEGHGGAAGVRNVPGRGATFWVSIPAATATGAR
jgi:signal transduction histidine kinase